jgi:hypothetical protein
MIPDESEDFEFAANHLGQRNGQSERREWMPYGDFYPIHSIEGAKIRIKVQIGRKSRSSDSSSPWTVRVELEGRFRITVNWTKSRM